MVRFSPHTRGEDELKECLEGGRVNPFMTAEFSCDKHRLSGHATAVILLVRDP